MIREGKKYLWKWTDSPLDSTHDLQATELSYYLSWELNSNLTCSNDLDTIKNGIKIRVWADSRVRLLKIAENYGSRFGIQKPVPLTQSTRKRKSKENGMG